MFLQSGDDYFINDVINKIISGNRDFIDIEIMINLIIYNLSIDTN